MKTVTNYTEVSEDSANRLLELVDADNVELTIESLHDWRQTGYGHWRIGIDIEVKVNGTTDIVGLTTVTTNSLLKDSWCDPDFIAEHDWYEDEQQVIDAYFHECLTQSNIDRLNELIYKLQDN